MAIGADVPTVMTLLARHAALSAVPVTEQAWLAAHGELRYATAGTVLAAKNQPVSELYIVFSGRVVVRVDRGAGVHIAHEFGAGEMSGHLPFSRMTLAPGDVTVEDATELLWVPDSDLAELVRDCPQTTAKMVHAMIDRARQFKVSDLHDEKLISLGKLAAGLAHELNNPASAVVRSAKLLRESLAGAEAASTAIGAARMSDGQWAAIGKVREHCTDDVGAPRTAMERADREDAISEWLADHHANDACAHPLSETGVTIDELDGLANAIPAEALDAALCWIAAGCTVRTLSLEIQTAATRIYDLVNSVKGFTFMDHAPTPEPVDIRGGINDTFTMLAGKVRTKNVVVAVEFADGLPRALAVGGELNQVWMNLIDNALDAVAANGKVSVVACGERGRCVVDVIDDGAGIPQGIVDNIFDPFFTTKDVGKGTGLGLDIVRRILRRHDGEIDVESRLGHTRFRVSLPVAR